MSEKFLTPAVFIIMSAAAVQAQDLYFQLDSTVVRYSADMKSKKIVWSAPFDIFDVSISRDGNFIMFTKWKNAVWEDKDVHDPQREVGIFSVADKKYSIIRSLANYNFGAVISPDDSLLAFNYLIQPGDWLTAVYDRATDSITYDVDSASVYGWSSDSTILLTGMTGVVEKNLENGRDLLFKLPDTSMMDIAVPGTQMFMVNDSTSFFQALDMVVTNPDLDGPIQNVFLTRGPKTTRILHGIVNVNCCVLCNGVLYVDYTDYNRSKKGIHRISSYNPADNSLTNFDSPGTLVGVESK